MTIQGQTSKGKKSGVWIMDFGVRFNIRNQGTIMILRFHDEGNGRGIVNGTLSSRRPFQGFSQTPIYVFLPSLSLRFLGGF